MHLLRLPLEIGRRVIDRSAYAKPLGFQSQWSLMRHIQFLVFFAGSTNASSDNQTVNGRCLCWSKAISANLFAAPYNNCIDPETLYTPFSALVLIPQHSIEAIYCIDNRIVLHCFYHIAPVKIKLL